MNDFAAFQRPGALRVTDEALSLVSRLSGRAGTGPDGTFIPAFIWYADRPFLRKGSSEWETLGPGIDVGTLRVAGVPKDRIWIRGGLRFFVQVPSTVIRSLSRPTLVLSSDDPPRIELAER
jgi:hypothetical protein